MSEDAAFDQPIPPDDSAQPAPDDRADAGRPGRGFWASVGWLVVFLVVNALLGVAVRAVWVAAASRQLPVTPIAWVGMTTPVTALLLTFWRLGRTAPRALALRRPSWAHLALIVLAIPALVVVSANLSGLAERGWNAVHRDAAPSAVAPAAGAGGRFERYERFYDEIARLPFWISLLVGCVAPGVAEEAFFRGFLGRGLVARFGVVGGVLLTSLLFALMHVVPTMLLGTFFLGVVLHFVYLTTRSLLAPVLLHLLNNLVVLNQWRVVQDTPLADFFGDDGVNFPLLLAALAALAGLAVILYRTRVRWVLPDDRDWDPGYPTAETPPACRHAVPRRRRAGLRVGSFAVGAYLLFGAMCAWTAVYPPPTAWSFFRQGSEAYDRRDFDEAIDRFSESIRRNPDYAWAHSGRGLALGAKGDYAPAIRDLTEAIRLEPNEAVFYANRAWVRKRSGDFAEARRDCDEALQRDRCCDLAIETRAIACFELAGEAYDRRDFVEAIAQYSEAIRQKPDYAWAYSGRGQALGVKGDYAGALADLTEAIRLQPNEAGFYANRGWVHKLRREFAEARSDCDEALRRDPACAFATETRAEACYELGRQAYDRDDFAAAATLYGDSIRDDPHVARAFSGRATARGMTGDHAGALADINEAIRLDPNDADFYANRAWVHNQRNEPVDAVGDAEHALRLNPKCAYAVEMGVAAHKRIWREAYARGGFDEVVAHTTAALRLQADLDNAYGSRGLALALQGNLAGALRDLTEAIRLRPSALHYGNRAWVHNLRQEFAAAIADSDRALGMNRKWTFAVEQRATAVGGLVGRQLLFVALN